MRGRCSAPRPTACFPYLGLLLSVRLDPDVERDLLALSADDLAEGMQEAFVTWAEALARARPLILAVDDLHWADATTRGLAERLLSVTDRAAVMLAMTLRPDPGSEGWALRLEAQTRFAHRVAEMPLLPLTPSVAGLDRGARPARPRGRIGEG